MQSSVVFNPNHLQSRGAWNKFISFIRNVSIICSTWLPFHNYHHLWYKLLIQKTFNIMSRTLYILLARFMTSSCHLVHTWYSAFLAVTACTHFIVFIKFTLVYSAHLLWMWWRWWHGLWVEMSRNNEDACTVLFYATL